ncbi:MAG: hypothetical protein ACXABY_11495 [Candidatus Thorarchaeota archaeon]
MSRLSYVEQLHRDAFLIGNRISHYNELEELAGKSRKAGLVPLIYERHEGVEDQPKWIVLSVFFHKNVPYYWLVRFKEGTKHVVSFTSMAGTPNAWPSCLNVKLVKLPSGYYIAHPEDVLSRIRDPQVLNYSTHRSSKSDKWWTCIMKRCESEIYAKLPLGKLYRAIDVGSIIPVFRAQDRLIGLAIK